MTNVNQRILFRTIKNLSLGALYYIVLPVAITFCIFGFAIGFAALMLIDTTVFGYAPPELFCFSMMGIGTIGLGYIIFYCVYKIITDVYHLSKDEITQEIHNETKEKI